MMVSQECGGGGSFPKSCLTLETPYELLASQAPLSKGFSRQGYWSGLPFPSPGDLPHPGIKSWSPMLQEDSLPSEVPGKPHRCILPLKDMKLYTLHMYSFYMSIIPQNRAVTVLARSCCGVQGAQPGTLWGPAGTGQGREGGLRTEGMHTQLQLMCVAVWQKPTQHCKHF